MRKRRSFSKIAEDRRMTRTREQVIKDMQTQHDRTPLNKDQRAVVVDAVKDWPKQIKGSQHLLELLDAFAQKILKARIVELTDIEVK